MDSSGPDIHFLNVEYFFRLLYEAFRDFSVDGGFGSFDSLALLASAIWVWVTVIAFLFAFMALIAFAYFTMRYRQVKEHEESLFTTIGAEEAEVERDHSRWEHIQELIQGTNENDWRQAIIEADIMLDDLLTQLGYGEGSVADKLKQVNPARFQTLDNAWEAHRVRNQIAHQGSSYDVTDRLVYRTIALYESVFREFNEI